MIVSSIFVGVKTSTYLSRWLISKNLWMGDGTLRLRSGQAFETVP
jgi:hypothetical protein